MNVEIQGPVFGQSRMCEPILRALPDWFGIEEATRQYVTDTDVLPTFLAVVENETIGFLSLEQHTPYAAEIHVMAVLPEWHRHGMGRKLVDASEAYLRTKNVEFYQVKTLSSRDPDVGYRRTRQFYLAMGFRPMEEFPTLWGEDNPCLQLVKHLG